MSLEFYCPWGSTVEFLYILKKYLKNWGSNVVGVLLSLEFFCLWSSSVVGALLSASPAFHDRNKISQKWGILLKFILTPRTGQIQMKSIRGYKEFLLIIKR